MIIYQEDKVGRKKIALVVRSEENTIHEMCRMKIHIVM